MSTSILTLFEDHEHNLWVGTDSAGLHVLRQQKFRTLSPLSGYAITAITQTGDGAAWLGTRSDGLFRYQDGKVSQLTTKDGLTSNVILALAPDRDGSLWIGTPDGLDHWQLIFKGGKVSSYTSADGLTR